MRAPVIDLSFNVMVRKLQIDKAVRLCTVSRPASIAERLLGRGRGDWETGRWRDGEMERWRDGEMERWRDGEMERLLLSVSLSPRPPVSQSPRPVFLQIVIFVPSNLVSDISTLSL